MYIEYYKRLNGTVTSTGVKTLAACGFTPAEIQQADALTLTVRDQEVSISTTIDNPATDVGHIIKSGDSFNLYLNFNIKNFKMIAALSTAKWTISLGRFYGK